MKESTFQKLIILILGVIVFLFFSSIFFILIDGGFYEPSKINEGCINSGYEKYVLQGDIPYCVSSTNVQQVITDCEGWFSNKQCTIIPISNKQ